MTDTVFKILAAIGGAGVIIIGISKLLGEILTDYLKEKRRSKIERELEFNRQKLNVGRVKAERYAGLQFDAYQDLWKSLYALRLAGDALWKNADEMTLKAFNIQLKETQSKVDENAFLFEEDLYQELNLVFAIFELFSVHKRSEAAEDRLQLERDIKASKHLKDKYHKVLNDIRVSFRRHLTNLELDGDDT